MGRFIDARKLKREIKDIGLICGEELVLKAIDEAPSLSSYDEAIRIIKDSGLVFDAIRDLTDIAADDLRQAILKLEGNG